MKWLAGIGLIVLILLAVRVEMVVSRKAPAPAQPIAFNHKIHAGEYQIACEYCHIYAQRTAVAGIPSVERCMGCHKITAANNREVQKLKNYWDRKQPIRWNKVTAVPDFVYFEHWPHIRSKIFCQTCHGPVQTMDRVYQAMDLTMSDCVSCHRERQVSIDCTICHR
jgi:Class III cytochrome C family/Cytochrome c7 and related cytochrome c